MNDLIFFLDYKLSILICLCLFYIYLLIKRNKLQNIWTWKTKIAFKLVLLGFLLNILTNLQFDNHYRLILIQVINFIIIVSLTNVLSTIVHISLSIYSKKKTQPIVVNLIDLLIYIFGAIVIIRTIFNIEITSILTTSAIITGAILFALQHSLTNIFSGITLQLNENFKPGTWIRVQDKDIIGEIVNRGFYYTTIKTLDNIITLIPNHYFYNNIVEKIWDQKKETISALKLSFGASYETPPHKIKEIVNRILEDEIHILSYPKPTVRLVAFGESSIEYEVRFFIDDFRLKDAMKDEINTRIWYSIIRNGLSFPYPHREIITKMPNVPYERERKKLLEILEKIDIFNPLSEDDIKLLVNKANFLVYAKGETIVRENEEGSSLFVIIDGEVNVLINNHLIAKLKNNDFFGEMSLLSGAKRNATVTANTECLLVEIDKNSFEEILKRHQELIEKLSTILAEREMKNVEFFKNKSKDVIIAEKKKDFLERLKNFFGI